MQIGKFRFEIDRPKKAIQIDKANLDVTYQEGKKSGKKLVLCVLPGRSGTRWLGEVFNAHKNATGVTERDVDAESYFRYIHYNKLPIDTSGIIAMIKHGIVEDWKRGDVTYVNSPYFSHGLDQLIAELKPDHVIFAMTKPKYTVQSFYNKGHFSENYIFEPSKGSLGYQPELDARWSHMLGRIVPNGEEYSRWESMTRIGKISWFCNRLVSDIDKQLVDFPKEKVFYFDVLDADQDYAYYKRIVQTFGLSPELLEQEFLAVKKKTFKTKDNAVHEWSDVEEKEFEEQTVEWQRIYKESKK